jgi:hypothetical protein
MENKVTTKENLIKRILEQRERLSFFGVTSIGLFGSFVRGDPHVSASCRFGEVLWNSEMSGQGLGQSPWSFAVNPKVAVCFMAFLPQFADENIVRKSFR